MQSQARVPLQKLVCYRTACNVVTLSHRTLIAWFFWFDGTLKIGLLVHNKKDHVVFFQKEMYCGMYGWALQHISISACTSMNLQNAKGSLCFGSFNHHHHCFGCAPPILQTLYFVVFGGVWMGKAIVVLRIRMGKYGGCGLQAAIVVPYPESYSQAS